MGAASLLTALGDDVRHGWFAAPKQRKLNASRESTPLPSRQALGWRLGTKAVRSETFKRLTLNTGNRPTMLGARGAASRRAIWDDGEHQRVPEALEVREF
jgi:hypothetical protein